MNLINDFHSMLFLDTSPNMINQNNGFHQDDDLSDRMTKIGYKNIQCKTFYSGNKIFMGQDASMFILDAQK